MQRSEQFERLVAQNYRDLGAKVEHNKNLGGLQIDVYVTHNTPDGATIRTAIECKAYAKPFGVSEAIEVCQRFSNLRMAGLIDKGVIIGENGFTQDARTHCANLMVECFELGDLQRKLADFSGYLEELVEGQYAPEEYVELIQRGAFVSLPAHSDTDLPIDSIVDWIDFWLEGNGQSLALLGEYGSGKTTTAWYIAQRLASSYLRTGQGRIPIIIELKRFSQNFSLRSFLTDFLLNQQAIRVNSYSNFEKLNKDGRFVTIFDGFDEMMTQPEPSLVFRHLDEIFSLAQNRAKVILTCRTSFFKDRSDLERLTTGRDLLSLLHKHRSYGVIYLSGFTAAQMQQYLYCHYGDTWVDFYHELQDSRISSLAERPILLNMIVNTIKKAADFSDINASALYERYTGIWLQRDNWRCHLTPEQRSSISKILAFELVRQQSPRIHHSELRRRVSAYFGEEISPETLDQYSHEVRTCTFLKNDLQGFYSFVHRSFAEFLAAKHLLDQMAIGNYGLLGEPVSLETLDFLSEIITSTRDSNIRYIWDILRESPDESHLDSHVFEVAVYLLLHCKESLADANLRNVALPEGADLRDADLRNADCLGLRGVKIRLDGADLGKAQLKQGTLHYCSFSGASLVGCDLEGADLLGSNLSHADLEAANFYRANFEEVLLTPLDVAASVRREGEDNVRAEQKRLGEVPNLRPLLKAIRTEGLSRKQTRRSMGAPDSDNRRRRNRLGHLLNSALKPFQGDSRSLYDIAIDLRREIVDGFQIVEASFAAD